jgi:MYXO-CTERM domain-containing protein
LAQVTRRGLPLFCAASLASATSAWAAISFVQAGGGSTTSAGATSLSVSLPAASAAGDTAIIVIVDDQVPGAVLSVNDNAPGGGALYSRITSAYSSGNFAVELWATPAMLGGGTQVTVELDGGAAIMDVEYGEYAGVAGFGASNDAVSVSASPTISLTPVPAGSWAVAGFAAHGGSTFAASAGSLREQSSPPTQPTSARRQGALNDLLAATDPVVNTVGLTGSEPWAAVAVVMESGTSPPDGGGAVSDGGSGAGDGGAGAHGDASSGPDSGTAPPTGPRPYTVGCTADPSSTAGGLLILLLLMRAARRRRQRAHEVDQFGSSDS